MFATFFVWGFLPHVLRDAKNEPTKNEKYKKDKTQKNENPNINKARTSRKRIIVFPKDDSIYRNIPTSLIQEPRTTKKTRKTKQNKSQEKT